MKVYKNHAFIVSEEPDSGMQVFDLTKLRGVSSPQTFSEDAAYSYILKGTESFLETRPDAPAQRAGQHPQHLDQRGVGLRLLDRHVHVRRRRSHIIDIRDPKNPTFAGCVSEDGYTHDNQCVNYRQSDPDPAFRGREICFDSNEDSLTIQDVTDKSNPVQLARVPYDTANYTHQGWLTEDRRFFLVDDELDEQAIGGKTRTYVFDVRNLKNPRLTETYNGRATSIDHNQYVLKDRSFQANYRSGLRILDVGRLNSGGTLNEVGFFDVYPQDDAAEFNGAWSNYPYFKSGIVIVSGIEQGLFVLRPKGDAAAVRGRGGQAGARLRGDRQQGRAQEHRRRRPGPHAHSGAQGARQPRAHPRPRGQLLPHGRRGPAGGLLPPRPRDACAHLGRGARRSSG